MEGFDSHRTIEKSPWACMRCHLQVRESPAAKRTNTFPSGKNSSSAEVLMSPPSRKNLICRACGWMDVCCIAILFPPPSGLSPSSGRVVIVVHFCIIFHFHIMLYVNKNEVFIVFLSKFAGPPLMERKAHNQEIIKE